MLKILKTDLYRCFCNLVFPLSVLGVTFVCLLSECYVDETEKSYTVLSVILARQQMTAVIQQLNYFEVWEAGIGQWAHIILPFLLTASYLSYFSEERSSGVILFYQIRSSKWTYCEQKLQRGTVSQKEMIVIANSLGVGYEQVFILPEGEKSGNKQLCRLENKTFYNR